MADTILSASVPPILAVATIHAGTRFAAGSALATCGISEPVVVPTLHGMKMMASKIMIPILSVALVLTAIGTGVGISAQTTDSAPAALLKDAALGVPVPDRAPPADSKPIDPALLRKLAAALGSQDYEEHSPALKELEKLLAVKRDGVTDFEPVLEPLFRLAGWGGLARRDARLAEDLLVRIGRPALPLLRKRLNVDDAHDRRVAAELLVRIGPPDAALAAMLRPLLTDRDNFVRKAAIEGLGTLGAQAKEAVDDLERVAANDSNLARRVAARIALIRVAGVSEERVRALAAFLDMKNNLKGEETADEIQSRKEAAVYAASALGELGPKAKCGRAVELRFLSRS